MSQYVDIFSPLAFHCKNLPINGLFSSTVVAAPFSDAGGHAKRKNRERRAEIYTISQAFETLKESPACIGKLVGRPGMSDFCRNFGVLPGAKYLKINARTNSHITTQRVRRSYGTRINVFLPLASAPQESSRRFPTLLAHGRSHHFQMQVPCAA
jgi:hypothetical protein